MPGSRYHQLARLATHPAFSHRKAALVCPICRSEHLRVRDYDRDFLSHEPTADQAREWLSWMTYVREARRRSWPIGRPAEDVR